MKITRTKKITARNIQRGMNVQQPSGSFRRVIRVSGYNDFQRVVVAGPTGDYKIDYDYDETVTIGS